MPSSNQTIGQKMMMFYLRMIWWKKLKRIHNRKWKISNHLMMIPPAFPVNKHRHPPSSEEFKNRKNLGNQ